MKYVPPEEFRGEQVDIEGVPFWSLSGITGEQREALRGFTRRAR